MMKKITLSGILALALIFFMVGCGKSYEEKQRLSKAEKAKLDSIDRMAFKVGVMPTLDCLPIYLAHEDSLFGSLGVDVHLRRYTAQMDCDTALARGRVEGAITDLIRSTRLQHIGTLLTYPIATDTYWQLITNRKSRISDLKQLSDKMIAITRYSATSYLADLAIDSVKPKFDVYRVQINDVNIRLRMLLNNEMDAMLLTEPQATKARMEKHAVLMDSRDKNVRLGVFAFRTKPLKEKYRQKQLEKFVKAYNMAVDSINQRGIKHYASILEKYCLIDKKTIEELPNIKFSHASQPRLHDLKIAERSVK